MKGTKARTSRQLDELPTLPSMVIKLLEIIIEGEPSIKELTDVLEKDQSISARLLRLVNSAGFGINEEVTDIRHAAALLGVNAVKKLVLTVSVYDAYISEHSGEDLDHTFFWQHCLATGAASRALAELWDYDKSEAYAGGLLHDIGKIGFACLDSYDYGRITSTTTDRKMTVREAEEKIFGIDHTVFGAQLLEEWGLPEVLVKAVKYHHSDLEELDSLPERTRRLAIIVQTADFICWTQGFGSLDTSVPPVLDPDLQEEIQMDDLPVVDISGQITDEIEEMAGIFDFEVPSADRFRQALQKANMELGRLNSLYEEARNKLENRVQELTNLNRAMQETRGTLDSSKVLEKILKACRTGLGFDRAFYLRYDQDQENLVVADRDDEAPGSQVPWDIEISLDGYFHKLEEMKEEGPRIVKKGREGPLETELLTRLDVNEIAIAPVTLHGDIHGLIVADNCYGNDSIGLEKKSSLQILSEEAGMALENAKLFEEAKKQAVTDELTGLNNRRQCMNMLSNELTRAKRYNRNLSVALLDLDHFKKLNDTYGHLAGDQILKKISGVLQEVTRDVDILGRYGGEEFLVILPETELSSAEEFGNRIRRAIERLGKKLNDTYPEYEMTVSIGVTALRDTEDTSPEDLIEKADEALYIAKDRGRNRVVAKC